MKIWWRMGVVLALGASVGWPTDWKARYPNPEGYVSDFARVIDAASKSQLEAYAASLEQVTGAQIALVTIPSLEGEPIEDVANTLFRAWGVGQKGKNEGILLMLSLGDRKSRLEVGYGLEPSLPDGFDGDVLRAMRPALRQNDVGDAMMSAARTIGGTIAEAKHVQVPTQLPPPRVAPAVSDHIPWPFFMVGGFILLSMLSRVAGRRGYGGGSGGLGSALPWIILDSVLGGRSGDGSHSGGGFGGFDSHDSFGGFGGGDSGGGGASSDW